MDKSTRGQQPQSIKIKADKTPKRWKYFILQPSRCTIKSLVMWSWYRCGRSIFSSCRSCGRTEKSQNGQKHHRTTAIKDKNQGWQNPQNMKIFYYSNHQGVRSHLWSCDHMIQVWTINILIMRSQGWTEKAKMDKSTIGQQPQRIKIKADKTPKRWKYFTTPTIKVYDQISGNVITWYRCGRSTFSSCGHVGRQRKAIMDKSTIGQQPQRIKIKADKTPKGWKYFTTPTIKVYDPISGHVITW